MRTPTTLAVKERIGGLVPFKARILAAVPGKSLNNRIYTKELLQQSAPLYEGKPFILDHDIEHAERVVGLLSRPRYSVERGMDNETYEGLWLDAVGLMDENVFDKVKGTGLVPPLVRGFSIGGGGEGDFQADGGILLKTFVPAEGSITAFPGIPAAHIAMINEIREHYLGRIQSREVKKTSIPVRETNVSLEEAEKQAVKVREGPLPPADNGGSVRSLGGVTWAQNDTRPGLPAPTVRKNVLHVQPQATTGADTGFGLDPEQHDTGTSPFLAVGSKGILKPDRGPSKVSQPAQARQPTALRQSWEQVPGTAGRGTKGSKDAKPFKPKTPATGATTTKTPGFGKLTPSGTGITDQPEEEEEEESQEAKEDMTIGAGGPPPLARGLSRSPTTRSFPNVSGKNTAPGDYPDDVKQLINPVSLPGEERKATEQEQGEEEEEDEEEQVRIRQDSSDDDKMRDHPGQRCGDAHSGMSHDDFMDKSEQEEEESHPLRVRNDDEPVGGKKSMNPFHPMKDEDEEEEEEEEGEEHGPSPHIPGRPVGKLGGHSAANAYDSPADKPEEGEEESEMDNPLLKAAGAKQNIGANPVRAGGEEEESIPPDTIPIQAKAFSLPPDTGVLQSIRRLIEPQHTSEEQALAMIRAWNDGKKPQEPKFQKLTIHKTRPNYAVAGDSSIAHVARPAPVTKESMVRVKSLTNIAPTWAATSVTTLSSRAQQVLEEVKRKPRHHNLASEVYARMVTEILDVR